MSTVQAGFGGSLPHKAIHPCLSADLETRRVAAETQHLHLHLHFIVLRYVSSASHCAAIFEASIYEAFGGASEQWLEWETAVDDHMEAFPSRSTTTRPIPPRANGSLQNCSKITTMQYLMYCIVRTLALFAMGAIGFFSSSTNPCLHTAPRQGLSLAHNIRNSCSQQTQLGTWPSYCKDTKHLRIQSKGRKKGSGQGSGSMDLGS